MCPFVICVHSTCGKGKMSNLNFYYKVGNKCTNKLGCFQILLKSSTSWNSLACLTLLSLVLPKIGI